MKNMYADICTWEWSEFVYEDEGILYQKGFDSDGYDCDGYGPDGLDRYGFGRNGFMDNGCGIPRKKFRKTRDGRGNLYASLQDGIIVVFPRHDLTYYDSETCYYRFYNNVPLGEESIVYRTYDSYSEYKKSMNSRQNSFDYNSELDELYSIGYGGADWGI